MELLNQASSADTFAEIAGAACVRRCSVLATAGDRVIPKSSLSQHFGVLREAGLIRFERQGVEMRNYSRCEEINQRFPGLLTAIISSSEAGQGG